jgi:hypothetical protein
MEAKELRIGNYVNIGLKSSDLRTDYDAITASGLMDLQVNKENSSFIYKPIPLTEEWLLKMGFTQQGILFNKQFLDSGRIMICVKDFSVGIYTHNYAFTTGSSYNLGKRRIKHVHSLQNLYFALTGEELTIKDN